MIEPEESFADNRKTRKEKRAPYQNPDIVSEKGRNKVAKDFGPLMTKIVNQWDGQCPLDRELLYMQAEYGLVYAMNHFKEGTSQNFIQYAAWCMRNWILNGIAEFGSTVRINPGRRSKMLKEGESVYVTFSIDRDTDDSQDCELSRYISQNPEEISYEIMPKDKAIKRLTDFVDSNFNDRARDIFYSTYELKGHKRMKGVELCKKYNCTAPLISQINRSVIESVRENPELMEILDSLR